MTSTIVTQTRMSWTDQDLNWMHLALALAARGAALCSPNPQVGCVLLDSRGSLIAEGWHQYDKRDHAEIAALKAAQAAGHDPRGGTAYVTLEPCSHTGRTGPCADALIAAGLARVLIATLDPNPLVAGQGIARLRAAEISVEVGLCQPEARRLNEAFARWIQDRRPFLRMKVAMTLDGRIAPPPGVQAARQPYWITSPAARAAVQPLRWQSDALLTGIDTVLADDPQLTDRSGLPRRRPLLRVVLDSALRMPLDSRLVREARGDLLLFTVSRDSARIQALTERGVRVEVLPSDSGRVPLPLVLEKLGEEGILTLLTETGTRLNTALLSAGLVDRLHLFISPQLMGTDAVPAFRSLSPALRMDSIELERYSNDLGITSLLRNPWPTE